MAVAIVAGKWGISPGNVLATLREEVREVRDLVRAGRVQANLGLVREVRDLVKTGRGQVQVGMVKVAMVKLWVPRYMFQLPVSWT